MSNRLLLDTDVLIDYFRGRGRADDYFQSILGKPIFLSTISVAEIYVGIDGKTEREAAESFFSTFDLCPVTPAIAREGGRLRRQFKNSHGLGLADALIAATAKDVEATLILFNEKHYCMLEDFEKPYERS